MSELVVAVVSGLSVVLVVWVFKCLKDAIRLRSIYKWLEANTADIDGQRWRSTKVIASHLHLTLDQVEQLCSRHKKIFRSTGEKEGMWSIFEREPRKPRGFFDLN